MITMNWPTSRKWAYSLCLLFWGSAVAAAEPKLTTGPRPTLLFTVPEYSEGIVFDNQGRGYISHGSKITRFTLAGERSIWAETGAPNGHKVLPDGTHLVCDKSRRAVLHLSDDGRQLPPAATAYNGKPLLGPNDLTLDPPNGGFFFTDPEGSDVEPIGCVYYVDRQKNVHLVDSGLGYPNGIAISPDGKKLFVSESMKNHVLAYDLRGPGQVGDRRVFAQLPTKIEGLGQINNLPDGICFDSAGNLYVAHYGMQRVMVLNPAGKLIRQLDGGNLTTSNVAFGGKKKNQLYVTGALRSGLGGLFRLDLQDQQLD